MQRVEVEVTDKETISDLRERAAGAPEHPPGYQAACMTCHDEGMMRQQHLTPPSGTARSNKMTGWGAKIKPEDREAILKYLSDNFK